jgi:FkbM family methyltransferase
MLPFFLYWKFIHIFRKRSPILQFRGILFTGFTSFSEFWQRRCGLNIDDLDMIDVVLKTIDRSNQPITAIDIGGNLGLVSLALAKVGFSVYVFEPIPKTFRLMEQNFRLNPRLSEKIKSYPIGVGSKQEIVEFAVASRSPQQNKILPKSVQPTVYDDRCHCAIIRLDTFLEENNIDQIDLLKMDVEGFEVEVLKGLTKTLKSGKINLIYSEVIPKALEEAGSSLEEFLQILANAGFNPVSINDELVEFDFQHILSASNVPQNILFKHSEIKE